MHFAQWRRLFRIAYIWSKYGLDEVIFSVPFLKPFACLRYVNPVNWVRRQHQGTAAERLRAALEELGPIFVKFGQILSTRRDLLPADILDALSKLQDQVQPFESILARQAVEMALGASVDGLFAEFSDEPLASASIAQVHAATLPSGETVVVKVLRPDIDRVIRQDVALMYVLAHVVERYLKGKRLKPKAVVEELEHNLLNELDLMLEAANASQLKRNFTDSEQIYVPKIHWDYCRENILVMERIVGIPVDDVAALKQHNVDLPLLAKRGAEIFYTQVFRDNFFHADMHPGNIFVDPERPDNPRYIAVDFGIVGSLNQEDKRYLLANFLAFFKRDYRQVAELHIESGWVPPQTRLDELTAAIRTVCEPIFERPLKDISFGQTLLRLFQIARQFQMEVQPQLLLLQKTLLNIEGMGRTLYPDLDLWATAKPFLENWMKQQVGPKGLYRRFRKQLPYVSDRLPELPGLMYQYLSRQATQPAVVQATEALPVSRRRSWCLALGVVLLLVAIGSSLAMTGVWAYVRQWFSWHLDWLGVAGVVLLFIGLWK